MAKNMTEDAVRDLARDILGLTDNNTARAGVGQLPFDSYSNLFLCSV